MVTTATVRMTGYHSFSSRYIVGKKGDFTREGTTLCSDQDKHNLKWFSRGGGREGGRLKFNYKLLSFLERDFNDDGLLTQRKFFYESCFWFGFDAIVLILVKVCSDFVIILSKFVLDLIRCFKILNRFKLPLTAM